MRIASLKRKFVEILQRICSISIFLLGVLLIIVFSLLLCLCCYVYWFEILPTITFLAPLQAAFFIYIMTCTIFNYFMAIFTPPGSPPKFNSRETHDDQESIEMGYNLPTCRFCLSVKPLQSHHCQICRRCVLKMDHHCPWINQCVGANNHRYFYLYLVNLSIACSYFSIVGLSLCIAAVSDINTKSPLILFAYLIASIIGAAIVMLTGWNTYLIGTGCTAIDWLEYQTEVEIAKIRGEVS